MLKHLSIQNFALIDHLEIDLEQGLSVITGETGAGKSILLGALSLILGNRADHSSLHDKSKKCIIEGVFDVGAYHLKELFEEYDLDYAPQSILRREISPQGKSRNFINDTPTTLENMRQLGERLIDIHSQHQSLLINTASFQLELIDALAGNQLLLQEYRNRYTGLRKKQEALKQLHEKASEEKKQEDYLNFQYSEIEALALQEGENQELELEQQRFAHSEEISAGLNSIQLLLETGEGNVLDNLSNLKYLLEQLKKYDPSTGDLGTRFQSVIIELQDIAQELDLKKDGFEYDPERHQWVEERLAEIHRLQRKHQLTNAEDLIALQEDIQQQLQEIAAYDEEIAVLQKICNELQNEADQLAISLSEKRQAVIPGLQEAVQLTLQNLGMPHASLLIERTEVSELGASGVDSFRFLFSANKGLAPELISKTASGGEVSRLMLAVKKVLAEFKHLPTILFDEIDTGVSGEIAEKMGEILAEMGQQRQVISITHLPQLAAKGKAHFYIYKEEEGSTTQTRLRRLEQEERVLELAKMLSGKSMTEAALNNARELLTQ